MRPGAIQATHTETTARRKAAERKTGRMPPTATMPAEMSGPPPKPRETAADERPYAVARRSCGTNPARIAPDAGSIPLDRGRRTHGGDCLPSRDFPLLCDMYLKGELKLDEVVTRRIGLGDVEAAFEAMHHGEVLRSVIVLEWPS